MTAGPPYKVGFLLLGGIHHILHLIPPAAELIRILKSSSAAKLISAKLGPLIANRSEFRALDALVVAERTSTLLKRLPGPKPKMIHIPHGAGDRAKSYDPRIAHFDHVIVAGPKDKRRMIEMGVVTEENCTVSGYLKTQTLKSLFPERAPLFDNGKPVVLYNPHFDKTLSSWWKYGRKLLEAFAAQDDYNLVFAPHIRLFTSGSQTERESLEAYGQPEHIIVDLGSEKSTDMTYTSGADIYVGDVSSQVYEFLGKPKPCLFLAHSKINWETDPDYAHWQYGPVCFDPENIVETVRGTQETHSDFADIQTKGVEQALGSADWNARQRAARQIIEAI